MTSSHANDNWPPILTRSEAAAMCRLTPTGFSSWVRRGIVPGPIPGTRRWSRAAIETSLSGEGTTTAVEQSPFEAWKAGRAH